MSFSVINYCSIRDAAMNSHSIHSLISVSSVVFLALILFDNPISFLLRPQRLASRLI